MLMFTLRMKMSESIRGSQKRKRQCHNDELENLSNAIQESLRESQAVDSNILSQTNIPLPGYDDSLSCRLCKIKADNFGENLRVREGGASLAELLCVAHKRFEQEEGRPAMDVAREIRKALNKYWEQHSLPLLKDISDEEVYRHFKFDHNRKSKPKIKEKMLRMLISMLDVSVVSCCDREDNGLILINRKKMQF